MAAILVPQKGTPTWPKHTLSCNFQHCFLDKFLLKRTIDPEIVDDDCFYLPFNMFSGNLDQELLNNFAAAKGEFKKKIYDQKGKEGSL